MTAVDATPIPAASEAAPELDAGQSRNGVQTSTARVELAPAQSADDAQDRLAGGTTLDRGQFEPDTQILGAPVDLPPTKYHPSPCARASAAPPLAPTNNPSRPTPRASAPTSPGQYQYDDQLLLAGGQREGGHHERETHSLGAAFALLKIAADTLDDVEKVRIATGNRLGAWDRDELPTGPERARAQLLLDALAATEHQATLELQRALRKHPLGPWVKQTIGIGEKQGARLIAAIGDPYWNTLEDRPRRGPAELWAYCGYAPSQKRRKGIKSNWNAEAKMRARLCAESCVKHMHSPYRAIYDAGRTAWADRETSDLHKHNHALRCVAKAILKDLYLAARDAA